MTFAPSSPAAVQPAVAGARLDALDAARAFALLLGIAFHASLSFMPTFIGWAVQDVATSPAVAWFALVSHAFRLELFFLLAGFFGAMTLPRQGVGAFACSRLVRLGVPFVAGWFVLRPLLVSGWIMGAASLRGDFEFWPAVRMGFAELAKLPEGLFTGTHLWFLYYLAMITALALLIRAVGRAVGEPASRVRERAGRIARWIAEVPGGLIMPALLTAGPLWFMQYWGMDTPDRTLRPHLPVLVVYGGCFALGWLLQAQPDRLRRFGPLTADRWIGAAMGIGGTIWLVDVQAEPGNPHFVAAHVAYVIAYAMMMWSLVSLTLGVFQVCCARPRTWVRYVADSSYWLYLVHLPVVVWLQVAVAEVDAPWWLKLAFVFVATIAAGLLSYDLGVRGTWIGAVLNGRRKESVFGGWMRRAGGGSVVAAAPIRGQSAAR